MCYNSGRAKLFCSISGSRPAFQKAVSQKRGTQMLVFENAQDLELAATLDCGQAFRWRDTPQGWQGIVAGRAVTVRRQGQALVIEGAQESDRAFWENYFALDMDYPALLARFCAGNQKLAACVRHSPGIRVLRQPFFETLCAFIISQNNNIGRIKSILERLCEGLGQPLEGGGYAFPTPQALARCAPEDLAFLRAGWRAAYLADAAQRVASGQVCEAALRAAPYPEAKAALMQIKGVGPKVADCVLLYSLSFWQAFPMDVWMKKAMAQLFPRGVPVCCRGVQGIAQQFIFDYARHNLPRGGSPKSGVDARPFGAPHDKTQTNPKE